MAGLVPTRSDLEDLVLDLILQAGFEPPDVNVALARSDGPTITPDFRWPHRKLIVEADGGATHDHDLARHEDALRDSRLQPDHVIHIAWREAVPAPQATVRRLTAIAAAHPP